MGQTIVRKGLTALMAAGALTPAVPTPAPATMIVLQRTGGFAGTQDSFLVDRSTPDGRRPLRWAASAEFRRLRGSYQPQNPCCDRFSYRITVTYRGGRHKTVTTVQGATAPRTLWDVITETERVGARSAGNR